MYRHHEIIVLILRTGFRAYSGQSQLFDWCRMGTRLALGCLLGQLVYFFLLVMSEVRACLRRTRAHSRSGVRGRGGGAENSSYSDAYCDR
jgi:hypothetical protein